MGKQINYYMTYNDFREIAQYAIDSGCLILRKENAKIIRSDDIEIVTPDENRYYFYIPEAGELNVEVRNGEEYIGGYKSSGNVVIEAGFSIVNHKSKRISRARLYSITGYYDETGNWVSRPECVKKVYDKLVRRVKKSLLIQKLRILKSVSQRGIIIKLKNGSIKSIFLLNCLH